MPSYSQQSVPTIYFIGVTTGQSTIRPLFPLWAEILGIGEAQLIGVDLPLHAPAEYYRQVVAHLKNDPHSLGALITSHKIDLMNAAGDLFDELDAYAQLCHEVSCISKQGSRLIGQAKDPITSQLAQQEIIKPGHWSKNRSHVLCLGAGGAGTALTVNLLTQSDPQDQPERLLVVNDHQAGLDRLCALVERIKQEQSTTSMDVEYILNADPRINDHLMAALPPASLVINATGMGKDRPGSPITDQGIFPERGIIWELNYRGALDFLHQASVQEQQRRLSIHDGWYYFLVGWREHIAEVFQIQIAPEYMPRLTAAAEAVRA